jgi:hypothetical protein
MDPDQVMEELDTSINESSNSSSVFKKTKRSKMGPKSQFSSAYLGTGIEWMDHNEDTDDGKSKFGFGSIKAGKRAFQDFLKAIQEEKNLLDLKRVRNDIVTQLRKKKAQIGKVDHVIV